MTVKDAFAELVVILALSAKPHSRTLHKSTNAIRNALADAKTLTRHAAKLQRCNEAACNGIERWDETARCRVSQWTEADEAKNERAIEKAQAAIRAIVEDYLVNPVPDDKGKFRHLRFQRDPRGSAVSIYFKHQNWHA